MEKDWEKLFIDAEELRFLSTENFNAQLTEEYNQIMKQIVEEMQKRSAAGWFDAEFTIDYTELVGANELCEKIKKTLTDKGYKVDSLNVPLFSQKLRIEWGD